MTDDSLLNKFADDQDQLAFAELVTRHGGMVFATARRIACDDADDIAQAVFLILSQKAGSLGRHQNLAGWLYKTTRFCAASALRQRRRREAKIQAAREVAMSNSSAAADHHALLAQLDQGLSDLPDIYRQVLLMRYMENLSVEQTAGQLGLTGAAVMKRSTRALSRLRDFFHRQGTTTTAEGLGAYMISQAIKIPEAQHLRLATIGAGQASVSATKLASSTRLAMNMVRAKTVGLVALTLIVPCAIAVKIAHGGPPAAASQPVAPAVATAPLPAIQPVELNNPRTVAERFLTELQNGDVEQVARYLVPSDSAKNRKLAGEYVDKFRNSIYARFPKRLALSDLALPAENRKADGGEFIAMHPTDADLGNLDVNIIRSGGHWYVVAAYYANQDQFLGPVPQVEKTQNKRENRPVSVDPDEKLAGQKFEITIPGPLKLPEWLRSTAEFKQWQKDPAYRTFTTSDDLGNIYSVSGYGRPTGYFLERIEMYRPDKTLAEGTVWDLESHIRYWFTADATGKHYIWKITQWQRAQSFSIDGVTHFDADGNQQQYTVDQNGHITREMMSDPIGQSSRIVFDTSDGN